MKITDVAWVALVLLGFGGAALAEADEERVLAALKKAYPRTEFTSVSRTPVAGLYEVWMGANVVFVADPALRYLIFGRLVDAETGMDLTAPKLAEAERRESAGVKVSFADLPLADAIKTVRGDGSRVMAVFSDPACPHCKRLEPELAKLTNVTIYTFLLPFQGVGQPLAIWCAPDRERAWRQYMLEGDASSMSRAVNCANPLDRNVAVARRLGVRGTPTIFFANGGRLDGYSDVAVIEQQLGAPARGPTAAQSRAKGGLE